MDRPNRRLLFRSDPAATSLCRLKWSQLVAGQGRDYDNESPSVAA